MTYLQLVNAVLRRLREEQATTVAESDYSQMIGDLVNEAKRLVEDSWDWSALRTTHSFDTVAGTSEYSLTDFGVRSEVFNVFDTTEDRELYKKPLAEILRTNVVSNDATNTSYSYAMNGVDANGDIKLRLFPTPNSTNSIQVYGVKRTDDLVNDSDTVAIPASCIISWAYSYALIERGETGGQSGSEQALFAKNDLSTAIALDAGLHSDELVWSTV